MNKTEKNIEVSKMYSGMSEREVLGCILLDDSKINEIIKYINLNLFLINSNI